MATTLIPPFSLQLVTLPHGSAIVKFLFQYQSSVFCSRVFVYIDSKMFPCPNFAKCLKTFETKAKQSNHYKNCLIDRICHRSVSKPVFKSESGFRYHAKMHKVLVFRIFSSFFYIYDNLFVFLLQDPTYPTVVWYGVGDTVPLVAHLHPSSIIQMS